MPFLSGMLLNAVDDHSRGPAYAFSHFAQNGFGLMPAPFCYGAISDLVNDDTISKDGVQYGI